MRLKPGVALSGVRPEVWAIIFVADPLWRSMSVGEGVTVTSAMDALDQHAGSHRDHPEGRALDLRVHDIPFAQGQREAAILAVQDQLQGRLGPEFVVLYEYAGTPDAHFHVAWRPPASPIEAVLTDALTPRQGCTGMPGEI